MVLTQKYTLVLWYSLVHPHPASAWPCSRVGVTTWRCHSLWEEWMWNGAMGRTRQAGCPKEDGMCIISTGGAAVLEDPPL